MTPRPPTPMEAFVEDVEFVTFSTLGFSSSDAWLQWRLHVAGIPASVHGGRVAVRVGTLTVEPLPERKVTHYTWTP